MEVCTLAQALCCLMRHLQNTIPAGMQVLVAEAWCPVSGKGRVHDSLQQAAERVTGEVRQCCDALQSANVLAWPGLACPRSCLPAILGTQSPHSCLCSQGDI